MSDSNSSSNDTTPKESAMTKAIRQLQEWAKTLSGPGVRVDPVTVVTVVPVVTPAVPVVPDAAINELTAMTASLNITTPSKNAIVAKNGFKAETLFCHSESIKQLLESYFKKDIQSLQLIGGRKKSDITITFKDGTHEQVQNKDGEGNNRGWSFDRRSLDKYPVTQEGRQLLGNVCLKQGTERPVVKIPENIIDTLLLGTEPTNAPTYFTHTQFDSSGTLIEFRICPTPIVMAELHKEAYPDMVPKRTCVHLSPRIYLQRKGGGKADHAPDDIQAKIKSLPYPLFTRLLPETTAK